MIKVIIHDFFFFLQARVNLMHKSRCGRAAVRIFLPPSSSVERSTPSDWWKLAGREEEESNREGCQTGLVANLPQ